MFIICHFIPMTVLMLYKKTVTFQFIQVRRVFSQNTILNAGDALSLLIIFIPNYRKEKL